MPPKRRRASKAPAAKKKTAIAKKRRAPSKKALREHADNDLVLNFSPRYDGLHTTAAHDRASQLALAVSLAKALRREIKRHGLVTNY